MIPAQGASGTIYVDSSGQMICDGKIFLHWSRNMYTAGLMPEFLCYFSFPLVVSEHALRIRSALKKAKSSLRLVLFSQACRG
jgi:hypothetical protein